MTADQLMAKGTVTPAPLAGPSGVGAASAALTAPVGAGNGWPGPVESTLGSHASAASAVAAAASQARWVIITLRPSGDGERRLRAAPRRSGMTEWGRVRRQRPA